MPSNGCGGRSADSYVYNNAARSTCIDYHMVILSIKYWASSVEVSYIITNNRYLFSNMTWVYWLSYTVLVPQMTGDDLPEGDVIENVSKNIAYWYSTWYDYILSIYQILFNCVNL